MNFTHEFQRSQYSYRQPTREELRVQAMKNLRISLRHAIRRGVESHDIAQIVKEIWDAEGSEDEDIRVAVICPSKKRLTRS